MVIVAPGAALGLERVENILQFAQLVAIGVVPNRILYHGGGKKLLSAQAAGSASEQSVVLGQASSGIKGLAKNMWSVTCQDGFKTHMG